MSYQVLARKYRPQRFSEMVGQEPIVRTLSNALGSGRVHHAYVFSGIRGIGKTTSARLLARALNCEKGPTAEPCGTCPPCVEITEGRSMDALEIDAASNRGIEEVKGLIQSAQYSPGRDRHKIFIVDEFHMLTREAFNALLKTLEEPPPRVVFILATTELEKVPDTILSRCLLLNFRAVSLGALRDHLLEIAGKEGVTLEPSAAELIARKAAGSVRDAQSTLDRVIALAGQDITREATGEVLGVVDAAVLRRALAAILDGSAGDALATVASLAESGADPQAFVDDLLGEARAAMLCRVLPDAGPVLGLPAAELADLAALAEKGSADDWRRIVDRLLEAGPRLRTASEPRFFLEALAVRLAHLTRLEPLAEVLARVSAGGAGSAGPPPEGARRATPAPSATPATPTPSPATGPAPRSASVGAGPSARESGRKAGWRAMLASGAAAAPAEGEDEDEPEPAPAPAPAEPPRAPTRGRGNSAEVEPLGAFRSGLSGRLRGQLDQGALRRHADGLLVVVPEDRAHVLEQLREHRYSLMASASAAFGRPAPVELASDAGLLAAPRLPGEVEGLELATRRLQARAAQSPQVRAAIQRFDGRVISVQPG